MEIGSVVSPVLRSSRSNDPFLVYYRASLAHATRITKLPFGECNL